MTPLEISVLLHYYARPGDFREGDFSAPIITPTLEMFVKRGLLCHHLPGSTQKYGSTEATRVFVEALCAVPAPVKRWVMPDQQGPRQVADGGSASG